MKARSREINIFNMSLLDILCGALGAFCFMMLVLFPYYSQDKGKPQRPEVQQESVDPKSFEEAKARIQQLEEMLKKFQNYADQMESRVKQLEAQARQHQSDLQQMQDRAERGEMRNPLIAVGTFGGIQADEQAQMYIETDRVNSQKKPGEKVDATKRQEGQFAGDMEASGVGSIMGFYSVRDTPPGEYRIYAKIIKMNPGHAINGWVAATGNGFFESVPFLAEKAPIAIPIGTVSVDADYKMKIRIVVPPENSRKPLER